MRTAHFISAFCFLISAFAVNAAPIGFKESTPYGLVAWWALNENTGTTATDTSGKAKTATAANAVIWTNGVIGSAVFFNSNKFTFATISIDPTNSTIAAWINPASTKSGYGNIINSISGGNGPFWKNVNRTIDYYGAGSQEAAAGLVASNTWTHIAISGNSLFVNGVSNFTYTGRFVFSAVAFGGDDLTSEYLIGAMDDLRIYNRALTGNEILQLYNGGHGSQH